MAKKAFPIKIRDGSTVVSIYRVRSRTASAGWIYQLCWTVQGARLRKSFADLSEAQEEAKIKAAELSAGMMEAAIGIGAEDLRLLSQARELCGKTPVLSALAEWKQARDLVGVDLMAAVRRWHSTHASDVKPVTVEDAVKKFIAAKQAQGIDTDASYKHCLARLVAALGQRQLVSISTPELQKWLETIKHPVSRNTHKKRIVALWRWSRRNHLLPADARTAAEDTERAVEEHHEIGIMTLAAWRQALKLIQKKQPRLLGALVVAGFCGLRRKELHGQRWSDIDLERGALRVSSVKRNTPSKRLVHLCPAAVEWLHQAERYDSGDDGFMLSPPFGIDQVRRTLKDAKIQSPENSLRHSFISYRCAKTGNVEETAHESGNSPKEIFRSYRELVSKADGEAWFNMTPAQAEREDGEVIDLTKAAAAS